jgi:hypothetical protein
MLDVVAPPGFHNKVSVAVVAKTELPQLLVTLTDGVDGIVFGAAVAVPALPVQPFTVAVTL